jgi:uncharacterized membrane protein
MLSAKTIGAVGGFIVGLVFILAGWKAFLILLGFTLFGLAIGYWLDSREGVTESIRRAVDRLFHS